MAPTWSVEKAWELCGEKFHVFSGRHGLLDERNCMLCCATIALIAQAFSEERERAAKIAGGFAVGYDRTSEWEKTDALCQRIAAAIRAGGV